ncbi:methanol/ethanol family PQQ-dependent dehydrogenase [Carboxydochorda subterranea]|uniref:Methanol/ethanol family PQQ-dependent dehydrogenase n=1 Tax=Carboxydichorda subterranea TaxID=3109565 RepID=A0ABZ1BX23_9FIRM|nr:methanol/ethanol family PQQ-dependent dehydrogenase [Limnochorda sp. L945t]WRP17351.1 methanol/ethanol family PQQ-dependent dehydrogenase [Limnochorda sp. L945t]
MQNRSWWHPSCGLRGRAALVVALLVVWALLASAVALAASGAGGDLVKLQSDDSQWVMPGKNYSVTRYSGLDQINASNVKNLKVAWTFSTGVLRGHEGSPLVVNDTMYFVTPFPNIVYALDLTKPGPAIKWKFVPPTDPRSIGVACCDVVNRGVAYGDGKIFFNTLDAHTYALDAGTGEVVWSVKQGDVSKGETITAAPLVVKDKVISGISGGEFGIRGFITANDIKTGKQVWRAYTTGPDEDVLIGPDFKPFYASLKGKDLGVETWPKDQWKIGGSAVWGWFSYDPELDLLYYSSGNPGTWNPDLRPGDNKWSMTIFARDPDTGHLKWAYQTTPHDQWDYDGVNEHILVDLKINGRTRKVLVHFDRNGFAYTIDRATGEVLVAKPFVHVNWAKGIDLKTGLPIRNPEKSTKQGVNVTNICPSAQGGKDQQPAAYSPRTGLFYSPTNNLCMDYEGTEAAYVAGVPYVGATVKIYPGPGGHRGEFIAWDATTGKKVWSIKEPVGLWGGALVTAGDVVFYGDMAGWFKAVDARTGKVLWKFKTGSGIIGSPMTYKGPDGKQYVAVLSGVGGWAGLTVAGDLSLDDPTGALGAVNAWGDLVRYTNKGGMLYVFSL